MTPIGFEKHDHADCIDAAIAAIDVQCNINDLHLTPVRRRVMEILLKEHRAVGAYDNRPWHIVRSTFWWGMVLHIGSSV